MTEDDAPVICLGSIEEVRTVLDRTLGDRASASEIDHLAGHLTAPQPGWEEVPSPAPDVRIFRRISDGWLRAFQRTLVLVAALAIQGRAAEVTDRGTGRLDITGDLRLRAEEDNDRDSQNDRFRGRARGRIGARYRFDTGIEIGARIATGSRTDPNSTHVDLGGQNDRFEVSLDRLYATWRPTAGVPDRLGLWATAGKFEHPFRQVLPYGELVWDADVQPEGIAGGIEPKWRVLGLAPRFVGGYYLLDETSNGPDATALVGQLAFTHEGPLGKFVGTTGAYLYDGATSSTLLAGDDQGNVLRGGAFASRFRIWTVGGRYEPAWRPGGRPMALAGEYWKNERAARVNNEDLDAGFGLGLTWGAIKERGDFSLYYQYQEVERESVFSPWAQDDFLLSTNFRGHVAGAKYRLRDRIDLHLWTLLAGRNRLTLGTSTADSGEMQERYRFDIDIRF